MTEHLPNNLHRLLKLLMAARGLTLSEAKAFLAQLNIHFICSEEIGTSVSLQAALLTAVNCAHRSYLGGVYVTIPADTKSLLPLHSRPLLGDLLQDYGAILSPDAQTGSRVIVFGNSPLHSNKLRVVSDGWRGGILPPDCTVDFKAGVDHALGGVLAGGLAVARRFMVDCSLAIDALDDPFGLSLWNPLDDWLEPSKSGLKVQMLPQKLWILGLGHLGQAYGWVASLLPFSQPKDFMIYLQDTDPVVRANLSAGLLCQEDSIGKLKTRVMSQWLEARGFTTRMVERLFQMPFQREGEEPRIAMCGFDNPEGRSILEKGGFDVVFECGLGGDVHTFDRLITHTFPQTFEKAEDIWSEPAQRPAFDLNPQQFGLSDTEECGVMTDELMGISISTAFVGTCAAAFLWAELLRGIQGGICLEKCSVRLRSNLPPKAAVGPHSLQLKLARNGGLLVPG